jgi:membrane protease YdiL (CAAX protease family)
MRVPTRVGRDWRNIVAGVLTAVPFGVIVVTGIAWSDRLPERLPTQWSGDEVASTQPTLGFFVFAATTALIAAVFGVATGIGSSDREDLDRGFLLTGLFAGLAAAVWIISAALGVAQTPDSQSAIGPWGLIALAAAAYGFVPYVVAHKTFRRTPRTDQYPDPPFGQQTGLPPGR